MRAGPAGMRIPHLRQQVPLCRGESQPRILGRSSACPNWALAVGVLASVVMWLGHPQGWGARRPRCPRSGGSRAVGGDEAVA